MKDLNSQDHNSTMATTTLNRIPSVHFPSEYNCGFSSAYSFNRSYPDHTDWGPTRPNPDELAAAIAIAQLSRSKGMMASRTSGSSHRSERSARGHVVRSDGEQYGTNTSRRSSDGMIVKNNDIDCSVAIKCEPEEEMTQENANIYDESRMKDRYDNYSENRQYVDSNQYSDVNNGSNRRSASPGVAEPRPSPTRAVPRIVLTTTERLNLRESSPDSLSSAGLAQSYDSGKMYAMNWLLGNGHENIFPGKPGERVSPNTHLSSRRLSPESRCPSSSSINLPPTRSERISPDSIGYPYYMLAESQPSLNTLELHSQENLSNSGRPKRRFETPTSFLKRKAQHSIDQARRRCYSDDSGIVRQRILQGKFGSLSTIAAYYKQFDGSSNSRLAVHDSAMDLSTSRIVNKTSTLDDSTVTLNGLREDTAMINKRTNSGASRGTTELAMAFKQFQLTGSNQAAIAGASDDVITTQCFGSNHNKNTCRLGNGFTPDLHCTTTADRQVLHNNSRPVLSSPHKHVDGIARPEIALHSELKDHECAGKSDETLQVVEANSPSRKSRSPTFQLPDNQLPPKKRRIFDECKDVLVEEVEASYRSTSEELSGQTFSNRAASTTMLSSGVSSDNSHGCSDDVTRDSLLSAVRPDSQGDLPLHIAVVRGMVSVVERLVALMLKLSIPIDTCNNQKQTALHLAVITDQPAAVDILLDAGASPSLTDLQGDQVIHLAVRHNSPASLGALLDRCHPSVPSQQRLDLDLNSTNYEGVSPLHMAVQLGHDDLIRPLLRAGANVDAKESSRGRTALYLALELEDHQATRLFLEMGANPTILTDSGSSPVKLAAEKYRVDIEELIGSSGAMGR